MPWPAEVDNSEAMALRSLHHEMFHVLLGFLRRCQSVWETAGLGSLNLPRIEDFKDEDLIRLVS